MEFLTPLGGLPMELLTYTKKIKCLILAGI